MTPTLPPAPLSVLVVDDEPTIRRVLARFLEERGARVFTVGTAADALHEASREVFDLVFLDLRLGSASGLDLLPELRARQADAQIIVITAHGSIETAVEAMRRGATDYLPKPFTPPQVALVVERAARERVRRREVEALRLASTGDEPAFLESQSAAMQRALAVTRQAASADATILLTGESGTGKSSLARAVHAWSPRAERPFVTFSAASSTAELLEADLFGHVRGAFTGAVGDSPGRVGLADGGTLFLDEIGEMPVALQPKLLRFLQDRAYERVGDPRERRADVRIVAATNSDLAADIAGGRFREDLYYRLSVIEVAVPALRERPEDTPALARHLLAGLGRRHGRPGIALTAEAAAAIAAYPWPGNLRELRNVLERAVILAPTDALGADLLPFSARAVAPAKAGDPITLAALDEAHVRAVLTRSRSYEDAAATLGIDQATLWRKRKQYGL